MKKMSKGMLMTALICGAVYLGGSPVYANELQEFALGEYVVTAARTETKLVDTPANISVVDAKTIEERHYQDVSEVLKDVPGANVLDSGIGAFEKVIKLNGDERVLVLVDGRRVNSDMGLTNSARASIDMNQLPDVNLIERIEVLKGAGGALYGSDAVGGVINIITKKADRIFGKVSIGYGSMGAKDYSAMYSIKEGKTGVSVAASKYEQDYYKYRDAKTDTTKRWPGKSNFKNEKVSLALSQELTDDSNLSMTYDYSKFDGFNPGDISGAYPSIIEKETQNFSAKYDWVLNNGDTGYIQYYHNELDYKNNTGWGIGHMEEETNGVDLQQTVSLSSVNKLVVGSSWRESTAINADAYANGGKVENIAIFINDTWEFAPTWTLNMGARYDDHNKSGEETTFSAGLNKKINDNEHIYVNWSEIFKAPNVDDLYYNDPNMGVGNLDLKPETGDTWTVGYSGKISNKTDFGINYFESDLKDAIAWDTNVWPCEVRNISNQKKKGMELAVNHNLNNNLSINASYTYLQVENDDGNGYYRDTNYVPNMYRLGLNYEDGKWNIDTYLRYGNGASTSYNPNKYNTPYLENSYLTLDLAVTYQATKDLNFYAKGYNLFNEAFADQAGVSAGSYKYPAQSRRFIVGVEYKF